MGGERGLGGNVVVFFWGGGGTPLFGGGRTQFSVRVESYCPFFLSIKYCIVVLTSSGSFCVYSESLYF